VKRFVALVLAGLLAFVIAGPASSKKKPKPKPKLKKVSVQFFLHTEEGCSGQYLLTLADGEDATDCFFGVDDMLNEYPEAEPAIGNPVDSYVASEGVPLTLDASRKVTGTMTLVGWAGTGVGDAEVDITLKATIAGEEKEIGTLNHAYSPGPEHAETVEFEFTIDPTLNKAVADTLALDVYTHGNVLFGRGIEHDSEVPPSLTVPALKKK
jgi:hypothetical protein